MVEDWLSAVLGAYGKYTLGLEALCSPGEAKKDLGKSGDDLTTIFREQWNGIPLLMAQL